MRNSGWLFLDKVLRTLAAIAVGIAIARSLGPSDFGQLSFAISFVTLFTPLAALGLDAIVVRTLVTDTDAAGRVLGSTAALRTGGALVAFTACIGASMLLGGPGGSVELIAIVSLMLLAQPLEIGDLWFQSQVASKYTVLAKLPVFFAANVARVIGVFGAAGVLAFAWIQSLEAVLGALSLALMYRARGGHVGAWCLDGGYLRRLMLEAWPVILSGISVILYMKVDVLMLERLHGFRETGIYSAATRLSEGLYFIPMVVASSLSPLLTRAKMEGPQRYLSAFNHYYLHSSRVALAVAALITAIAPWLIPLLLGAGYQDSVLVLQIHVWALIAVALGVASAQYINIERKQKVALLRTTTGLVTNILLNLLLIPVHGAAGAALATLISYSLSTLVPFCVPSLRAHMAVMLNSLRPAVLVGLRRP